MHRLILIRHAKSSWDDPDLDDHDRPLNARGRRAAPLIGGWLAAQGIAPDEVLTSSAARTRETWALMAGHLPGRPAIRILPQLYHASPDRMLSVLQAASGAQVVMLGHNPGIAGFAALLADKTPADADFLRYPTAAATVFDFDIDTWEDGAPGLGRIAAFTTPRALES
jgi:phosphohistidine phosphatase